MDTKTISKIYQTSVADHTNPYLAINWPEKVDVRGEWFMAPELISLYGTEYYSNLNEAQQKELSFWEAVNFFSLNVHGEKALIQGLARRLYQNHHQPDTDKIIDRYIHVFLAEENQHMSYFGGFCTRYAKGPYRDKKVNFSSEEVVPGEEDFLFFAKVLIFEEIVDVYNRKMAADKNLNLTARAINCIHHHEEVRHLIFNRQIVSTLFQNYVSVWSEEILNRIRKYIHGYFFSTWSEYYNPDVYQDAGFEDSYLIRQTAFNNPVSQKHRQKVSKSCIEFLLKTGILNQAPKL